MNRNVLNASRHYLIFDCENQVTNKSRFETHFVGRTNIIFERARFNKRVRGKKEFD